MGRPSDTTSPLQNTWPKPRVGGRDNDLSKDFLAREVPEQREPRSRMQQAKDVRRAPRMPEEEEKTMSSYSFLSSAFSSSLVKRLFSPIYTQMEEHESQKKNLQMYRQIQFLCRGRGEPLPWKVLYPGSCLRSLTWQLLRERAQVKREAWSEHIGLDWKHQRNM